MIPQGSSVRELFQTALTISPAFTLLSPVTKTGITYAFSTTSKSIANSNSTEDGESGGRSAFPERADRPTGEVAGLG